MGASVCECVRERGRERERVSKGVSQRVRAKDREIAFTFRPGQLVRISHSETFIEKSSLKNSTDQEKSFLVKTSTSASTEASSSSLLSSSTTLTGLSIFILRSHRI